MSANPINHQIRRFHPHFAHLSLSGSQGSPVLACQGHSRAGIDRMTGWQWGFGVAFRKNQRYPSVHWRCKNQKSRADRFASNRSGIPPDFKDSGHLPA